MQYTIKEVATIMNVPTSTIRYYDKEGLLPNIQRKDSGYRIFNEGDISLLKIIECFKKTGLSIKEMKQFSDWLVEGDNSLENRYTLFLERKEAIKEQIRELEQSLELVNHKCDYYKTAIEAGTEKIHENKIG